MVDKGGGGGGLFPLSYLYTARDSQHDNNN